MRGNLLCLLLLLLPATLTTRAAESPLTLNDAVQAALKAYPSVRVSQAQLEASAAAIALARTAYLPRVDLYAQVNRATRNNVFGLLLPQSTVPAISGPVLGTNNLGTAWGSAVGTLVTWEPFDFGLRGAGVASAAAVSAKQAATLRRTEFDVGVAAADAYLTMFAAQQTVRAAQAGVDRADVIVRTIGALVNAELRPGADGSRAQAESAAARTQLIQAEQAVELARANLTQFTGLALDQDFGEPHLLELPPEAAAHSLDPAVHPAALEQRTAVAQVKAQLRILERSYFPRFYLQGAAYARGTGAEVNGTLLGGANGLAPTTQDYALGFTVNFPLLDLASLHAREAEQSASVRAEDARYQLIVVDLQARWNSAVAILNGARRIAANTPVQLAAAQAASGQATARYQSGLGNVDDVAEAQRLLTQSEIDNALAGLNVWRALLGVAAAAGDIQPFLAEASR